MGHIRELQPFSPEESILILLVHPCRGLRFRSLPDIPSRLPSHIRQPMLGHRTPNRRRCPSRGIKYPGRMGLSNALRCPMGVSSPTFHRHALRAGIAVVARPQRQDRAGGEVSEETCTEPAEGCGERCGLGDDPDQSAGTGRKREHLVACLLQRY